MEKNIQSSERRNVMQWTFEFIFTFSRFPVFRQRGERRCGSAHASTFVLASGIWERIWTWSRLFVQDPWNLLDLFIGMSLTSLMIVSSQVWNNHSLWHPISSDIWTSCTKQCTFGPVGFFFNDFKSNQINPACPVLRRERKAVDCCVVHVLVNVFAFQRCVRRPAPLA